MYISIDLGGTKTRLALSKDLHSLDSVDKFPSLKDLKSQKEKLSDLIKPILETSRIEAVSIGIPGTFDLVNRRFLKVPNYKLLEGSDFNFFADLFESDTKLFINNDAALACLAEAVHGAGKQYKSVAFITLSTGVGGALVTGKKLYDGSKAFEPGHHILKFDDKVADNAGIFGSMESFLSGTGFKKRYGVLPEDCSDASIWENYGTILGAGLVNVCAFWNPDVIVLGGSLSSKYEYFLSGVTNYLSKIEGVNIAPIKKGELEDDAGLVGGFEFISQKVA